MKRVLITILFGVVGVVFSTARADEHFYKVTLDGQISYIVTKDYLQKNDSDVRGRLVEYRTEAQYKEITGFWTPSRGNVSDAAKAAYRFLKQAKHNPRSAFPYLKDHPETAESTKAEVGLVVKDYSKYRGQYVGFLEGGRKKLICNYLDFSDFPSDQKPDLSVRFIDVNDGGYHFWQVEYDLESKSCSNLQINGPWDHDR